MEVSIWLFIPVLMWAVTVTYVWLMRPFPDLGHRCFAVVNADAAKTIVSILRIGGLKEKFTFDAGPTHQTVLSDNQTVIIWHDASNILPPNAISIAVKNPLAAARAATQHLRANGFSAEIHQSIIPEVGDTFVGLTSSALRGWLLGFRLPIAEMEPPPNKRKLLN